MSFPHRVRPGRRAQARLSGRRTKWFLGAAALLLVSGGVLFLYFTRGTTLVLDSADVSGEASSTAQDIPPAGSDEFMPPFSADTFEGKRFSVAEYEDKTAVIIDFWASWCSFCVKEMPLIQHMADLYGKDKLTVVGIHRGDSEPVEKGVALAAKLGIKYLLLQDPEGKYFKLLGQGKPFMPLTIFIDREGRIVERRIGPKTAEEIRVSTAKIIAP
ncbi:MAG: TlpA disulfide reductase family protein [Patescibacteria group bacterium]